MMTGFKRRLHPVKYLWLLLLVLPGFSKVSAQRKISFLASDQLVVTADLYLYDTEAPYMILLHQENSSRGEYREIAPRMMKLGFNCLAVDLRNGKESNFVQNETAVLARQNNLPNALIDCEKDIIAAIDYISKTALTRKCVLFGSSFSASLAMKTANHNKPVVAVIAFSPGEYFSPDHSVKDWLTDFDKLLFAASTQREYPFVTELLEDVPQANMMRFQPSGNDGVHGAPALWKTNASSGEYWTALMMFIKNVREKNYKN